MSYRIESLFDTVDCAKLQLELLKLYKPSCLEILETLRDTSADPADKDSDKDGGGSNGGGPPREDEVDDAFLC